jgi:hypothetical protein
LCSLLSAHGSFVGEDEMTQAVGQVPQTRRRAPRYDIEAPVRFWVCDGPEREGTTVNVGRLGMLFRTPDGGALPIATVIQVRMALSAGLRWAGAYVACTGRVVRAVPSPLAGETLVAATIDESALWPAESEGAAAAGSAHAESPSWPRDEANEDSHPEAGEGLEGTRRQGRAPEP